jgi:hypothetical protein
LLRESQSYNHFSLNNRDQLVTEKRNFMNNKEQQESIDPRDHPPQALLHDGVMNGWDRLQEIWFRLYRTVGTSRDQLTGNLRHDHYEEFGSVDTDYIEDKFQYIEELIPLLRKNLSAEERPYMEKHLEIVSAAVRQYKDICLRVAGAIDEFLLVDDRKWQKTIRAAYECKPATEEADRLTQRKVGRKRKKRKPPTKMSKKQFFESVARGTPIFYGREASDQELEYEWNTYVYDCRYSKADYHDKPRILAAREDYVLKNYPKGGWSAAGHSTTCVE